jgi:hypothetical protein
LVGGERGFFKAVLGLHKQLRIEVWGPGVRRIARRARRPAGDAGAG